MSALVLHEIPVRLAGIRQEDIPKLLWDTSCLLCVQFAIGAMWSLEQNLIFLKIVLWSTCNSYVGHREWPTVYCTSGWFRSQWGPKTVTVTLILVLVVFTLVIWLTLTKILRTVTVTSVPNRNMQTWDWGKVEKEENDVGVWGPQ